MTTHDVATVLAELTLPEKASLVSGSGFWHSRAVERLGIASVMLADGPHGLRKQEAGTDHVGANASVPATCFPTAAALGSSWDVDLVTEVGRAIGVEARAQGVDVVLGPGINIKRSPRCGRNFEYLSEDPVLSGVLGAAMVAGIQSEDVGACLKHFAVNNQETDRLRVSAVVDERTLHEIYLAGFERAVRDAGPWTVMCSYNKINGTYASEDPWLLTEVLRDDWGFDGLVMSDWGAVADPVAAVRAGLDLEMPSTHGASARAVVDAVEAGDLDESVLDVAIGRLLGLLDRAGAPADPSTFEGADAHHALARRAAAESAVLLKNDDDVLPLDPSSDVAVIGELARTPRYQGAGSSKVNPTQVDDALGSLRAALGEERVRFAAGYGLDDPAVDLDALRTEAVEVAGAADVVVCFLGLPASWESEGFDRPHLDLPPEQVELVAAVAAANPRVAVVLANGGVVETAPWQDHAPALLEAWLGGQAGGAAIADVLTGVCAPAGRLAETIPLVLADTSAHLNFPGEESEVRYGEGIFVGYRHLDAVDRPVAFPFGHGLTYTTFAHDELDVVAVADAAAPSWRGPVRFEVSARITNTGARRGQEVVQLYLGRPPAGDGAAVQPVRQLAHFAKVDLEPAESTVVRFAVTERDLARWSTRAHGWVTEPGEVVVEVGASSRDLRLRQVVSLDGARPALPLDEQSSLGEWLDHPVGRDLLLGALRDAPGGDLSGLFTRPEQLRTVSSFPLPRLLAMLGDAVGPDPLARLLDQVAAEELP